MRIAIPAKVLDLLSLATLCVSYGLFVTSFAAKLH
jgi:hypothetical protein